MLMQLALFTEDEYLRFLHISTEISREKIEENKEKIKKVTEYINKKTSNSEIF